MLGINIAKAENKKILYNVNLIQEALSKGVQISFDYMVWDRNKKLVKKSDRRYNMNPWALIWANDRYYLYGYDVKEKDGVLSERNYRVDKLDNIKLSDIPRAGKSQFRIFNANTYVSRRMGMFSGKEQVITVRIPDTLVGPFIDQFGKRITISEYTEGMLLVTFNAVIDEFDATKDTIQSELIDKSLAMQEDYIQLFRQIYRTLNPNDFSSSMRQAMDEVEKLGNRNTFTTLMDEAREIAENYHVRLSIKTKEDLVDQRQIFLFNDGSFHTVLKEGAQYIRSSLNKEDNRIDVFFEGKIY